MDIFGYNAALGSEVASGNEDRARRFMDRYPEFKPNDTVRAKIKVMMPSLLSEAPEKEITPISEKILKEKSIAELYLFKLQDAQRRNIHFDLTISDMRNILKRKTCYYTGVRFDNLNKATFERVDNSVGYTAKNTVLVTSVANKIKNELFENPLSTIRISVGELQNMLNKIKVVI